MSTVWVILGWCVIFIHALNLLLVPWWMVKKQETPVSGTITIIVSLLVIGVTLGLIFT